ncbi:MAG: 2'-5' RNA ligase family protein [Firmicutes bacterium]|nr:2'-5' RNA ligase family protein [Bacillota bacterium]
MAEQFLTLMADLDEESQQIMTGWYSKLQEAGFRGTQTPDLPYHISLATFPLDQEDAVVQKMKKIAAEFTAFPVLISHIGIFPGGKVLFGAPEKDEKLISLHVAFEKDTKEHPWTPHATILIDEPETVCEAVPVLVRSFYPFVGKLTRLHLCAFWPTREIAAVELSGEK